MPPPGFGRRRSFAVSDSTNLDRDQFSCSPFEVLNNKMDILSEPRDGTTNAGDYPLVSAVLAVRNEERHIEAVLKSLLQQRTSGWELEIIVVDGDSSDGTQEIVKRIANGDSRVRLEINKQRKTPYAF